MLWALNISNILYFSGDILYTPENMITEDIMKKFNRSFQTFEEFKSFAQPYGSLYFHLKDIENYETQSQLLTILTHSRFFEEYTMSNIANFLNFTQFIKSNVTELYENIKDNMNILEVTNQATR